MFRNKKSPFVDINFAPKPAKWAGLKQFKEKLAVTTRGSSLYILSAVSFVGIFISSYTFKYLIEKKKATIENIRLNIRTTQVQIRKLDQQIAVEQKKFYRFYIPKLKEKLLYILFTQGYKRNVKEAVSEFLNLTNNISPYIGFAIYPNIFRIKASGVPTLSSLKERKPPEFKPFKDLFGKRNPLINPDVLKIPVVYTPSVFIAKPAIKADFYKALQSIKSEDLKANILLEYLLINRDINKWNYNVPVTLIFPLNLVFADADIYKKKFSQLQNYCNYLIINKSFSERIYINNSLRIRSVIDGICIKNIY